MKKNKKRIKIIITVLLMILIIIISIKVCNISSNEKDLNELNKIVTVKKIVDDNNKTIYKNSSNKELIDYTNMSMMKVNLNSLIKRNSDVIGYIYIPKTNFKMPIMKSKVYLNHNFNRKKSKYGLPYLYNKNDNLFYNNNIIITKQHSLNDVLKKEFLKSEKNLVIKVHLINSVSLWQIVSIYKTKNFTYKTNYNEASFKSYINEIISNNEQDIKTDINENDRVLTVILDNKEKLVVHAKLIKMQST